MADFKIDQWVLRKQNNLPVESLINCCKEQEINFQPIEASQFYCQSTLNSELHYKKNSQLNSAKSKNVIFPTAFKKIILCTNQKYTQVIKTICTHYVFGSKYYYTNYSKGVLGPNILLCMQKVTHNQERSMKYSDFNSTGILRSHVLYTVLQFIEYSTRSTDFSNVNSTGIPMYIYCKPILMVNTFC